MPDQNGNAPATKADLEAFGTRMEERMDDKLNAFYGWGKPPTRRMSIPETRVLRIEEQVNLPPSQES